LQEIDEMLSNHLTLDDEDAVQAELRELQAESVSQKWVTELSVF
jgi:charged multivesicular body protein 6